MADKIPEDTKMAVMDKIHAGTPLRQLIGEYHIAYPKLLSWKKELSDAKLNGQLHNLLNIDEIVLESVAHKVEQELITMAPDEAELIRGNVQDVVEGAKGLNVLDTRLQTTALAAADKLHNLVEEADGVKGLNAIIDGLCKIQQAFFNRGSTVNIQNNVNGEQSGFKKFMRD